MAAAESESSAGIVYIVLVNWNGWRDTVECLASVIRCEGTPFRLVVCDNGSGDESLVRLVEWAEGKLPPVALPDHRRATYTAARPVRHQVISRATAERGPAEPGAASPLLTLVDIGENLGFGAACNVGIRYALRDPRCGHVWLLNNDTVVEPDALSALLSRMRERPEIGQCGSRLLSYDEPHLVQTLGGERYNSWLGMTHPIGAGEAASASTDVAAVERRMSYVTGASLCLSRAFLEEVGLLEESYFLYYEEIDLAARGRGRFALGYAHGSVVYHKEGQSIGSHRQGAQRSAVADYFFIRSRLRFTRRHAPLALPAIILGALGVAFNRLRRGQPDRALMALRLVLSPESYAMRRDHAGARLVLNRYDHAPEPARA